VVGCRIGVGERDIDRGEQVHDDGLALERTDRNIWLRLSRAAPAAWLARSHLTFEKSVNFAFVPPNCAAAWKNSERCWEVAACHGIKDLRPAHAGLFFDLWQTQCTTGFGLRGRHRIAPNLSGDHRSGADSYGLSRQRCRGSGSQKDCANEGLFVRSFAVKIAADG
jgi:hypothetical protein